MTGTNGFCLMDRTAPQEEVFALLADPVTLQVRPEQTVFVGDRLNDDIGGAQPLGMGTVLTREFRQEEPGEIRPDAVIERLTQLPSALDRLEAAS